MRNKFDPSQLEREARAMSEKVFSGLSQVFASAAEKQKSTYSDEESTDHTASGSTSANDTEADTSTQGFGAQLETAKAEAKAALDQQILSFMQKMNVVTQEDYELQRAMLEQAMHQIDALEKQIADLNTSLEALAAKVDAAQSDDV